MSAVHASIPRPTGTMPGIPDNDYDSLDKETVLPTSADTIPAAPTPFYIVFGLHDHVAYMLCCQLGWSISALILHPNSPTRSGLSEIVRVVLGHVVGGIAALNFATIFHAAAHRNSRMYRVAIKVSTVMVVVPLIMARLAFGVVPNLSLFPFMSTAACEGIVAVLPLYFSLVVAKYVPAWAEAKGTC